MRITPRQSISGVEAGRTAHMLEPYTIGCFIHCLTKTDFYNSRTCN